MFPNPDFGSELTIYDRSDECIETQDTDGAAYRGTQSVTESGLTCQRWDSQGPNEHTRTPER